MSISVREAQSITTRELQAPSTDRREEARHVATYRPCCVVHHERMSMGVVRNMSPSGACVESDLEMEVGDMVTYFWEEKTDIAAKVIWKDGNRFGLSHVKEITESKLNFPPRSVRVPCNAEANVWVNGECFRATIENLSLGGMRITGLPPLDRGLMMTICFCGLEIEAASARWSRQKTVGVRFSQSLTRTQIANLLLRPEFALTGVEFSA